jgi:hypothetical protein
LVVWGSIAAVVEIRMGLCVKQRDDARANFFQAGAATRMCGAVPLHMHSRQKRVKSTDEPNFFFDTAYYARCSRQKCTLGADSSLHPAPAKNPTASTWSRWLRWRGTLDDDYSLQKQAKEGSIPLAGNWPRMASTHVTFEAYCQDRWGFSRYAAYDYIQAAAVVKNVESTPQNVPSLTQAAAMHVLTPRSRLTAWSVGDSRDERSTTTFKPPRLLIMCPRWHKIPRR